MGLFDTELTPERKAAASVFHVQDMDEDQRVVLSELSKVYKYISLSSDSLKTFYFLSGDPVVQ